MRPFLFCLVNEALDVNLCKSIIRIWTRADQLKAENAQLNEQLPELEILTEGNIKLKTKLEVLIEVFKAR